MKMLVIPGTKIPWCRPIVTTDPLQPEWADVEPADPRKDCPWKCKIGDPKCLCLKGKTS